MWWNGFGRTLLFGAVAACGYAPFHLLAGPWLGWGAALGAYALLLAPVYLLGLGAGRRASIAAAGLAVLLALPLLLLVPSSRDWILGAAAILGVCRSGMLYRSRPARAVLLESTLLVAGLLVGGHLLGGSLLSGVLAVWGFFLVQSVFFLVGGVRERPAPSEGRDPFDTARDRALALLDGRPGAGPGYRVS